MKDGGEFVHKYQIKDFELISGIKAHTIRIWEKRYNLFLPERTTTNIRYYSDNDLKKLLNIVYLLKRGYKISEFKELNDEVIASKVKQMSSDEPDSEAFIIAILDYNYSYFNKLIEKTVALKGKEAAITEVIYPIIEKIGLLWMTGSINPSHEHFFSNIIKQKLFSWIDALPEQDYAGKTFLMFLPFFEQHEIGLLLSYFLAKSAGHRVVYLGQNVPTDDVVKAAEVINPDYLLTFFVSNITYEDVRQYLVHISEQLPEQVILASGNQLVGNNDYISDRIKLLENPEQIKLLLS